MFSVGEGVGVAITGVVIPDLNLNANPKPQSSPGPRSLGFAVVWPLNLMPPTAILHGRTRK